MVLDCWRWVMRCWERRWMWRRRHIAQRYYGSLRSWGRSFRQRKLAPGIENGRDFWIFEFLNLIVVDGCIWWWRSYHIECALIRRELCCFVNSLKSGFWRRMNKKLTKRGEWSTVETLVVVIGLHHVNQVKRALNLKLVLLIYEEQIGDWPRPSSKSLEANNCKIKSEKCAVHLL